jgi:hypothetical protein
VETDSSGLSAVAKHELVSPAALHYYVHDAVPHSGDTLPRAVTWLKLSTALHAPIPPVPRSKPE